MYPLDVPPIPTHRYQASCAGWMASHMAIITMINAQCQMTKTQFIILLIMNKLAVHLRLKVKAQIKLNVGPKVFPY